MALEKEKILDNGVTGKYWKIVYCDVVSGEVKLGLFVDKSHAANLSNILTRPTKLKMAFEVDEMDKPVNNPIKQAYVEYKKSKMSEFDIYSDVEEQEFVPVETNWFNDAKDV